MPIPKTRAELVDQVTSTFAKLGAELDDAGPRVASLHCVDDWTVKDLLAVRAWWTERVIDWVQEGRRGGDPVRPAPGYRWSETPRLNDDTARAARRESYPSIRRRLDAGYVRVLEMIDSLDDHELLDVGAFAWAGKWPIARWISINTARQYTTARTFVRQALRESVPRS